MEIISKLFLLIFLLCYQNSSQKTIPDSIIIPKTIKSKLLPTQSSLNEEEPHLKVSPQMNLPPTDFKLIEFFKVLPSLYIDEKDSEYDGISLIAEALKSDLARVIGGKVEDEGKAVESENGLHIITDKDKLTESVIIAGTHGENGNGLINQLIKEGTITVVDLENKWESYLMQVVKRPISGVKEALVIVGNDKRGTIYGLLHISEMLGVSPWVWWADVLPTVQEKVVLPGRECNLISKEPSIKYRGIFLNDEAPSLSTWTKKRYGGRNEYFYKQVFELLLRLKANYLWPSMWDDTFSEDGKEDKQANAKLADAYGIIMGTSHHEPLYRAGKEWSYYYKNDLGYTSAQAWNLYNMPGEKGYNEGVNKEIEEFWESGVERNKEFDNICTVGMRGEEDSSLPAADDPPKYAELLNYIINTQKKILQRQKDTNPTQLVIYKEVEDAWYAGKLYDKDCMKDTYAMFCDDNWSYMRTLPTLEQQKKVAGLGMYYHFDYVGAPKSYTWVQNTQISRVWDQMSIAYDYGINAVWIVNVGDLKPMELDISYFLDLAYNYEYYGVEGYKKIDEYKKTWARQQFYKSDGSGMSKKDCDEISSLIDRYLDLESKRKVEHVLYDKADSCSDMFSVDNYREALNILEECEDLMKKTEEMYKKVPDKLKASFYQLVYYPAMAVPNVLRIQIYAALNNKYANLGLSVANDYAQKCSQAIELDNILFDEYNEKMPGDIEHGTKWSGMISCGQNFHIGLQQWDRDSGVLPKLKNVEIDEKKNSIQVLLEGITNSFKTIIQNGDVVDLPTFHEKANEIYEIQLCSKGGKYSFTMNTDDNWIFFSQSKKGDTLKMYSINGLVISKQSVYIQLDWSKIKEDKEGYILIKSGESIMKINIKAKKFDLSEIEPKTYLMTHNYVTIDVARYSKVVDGKGVDNKGDEVENKFIIIPDNGKYLSALRTTSSTITYENVEDLKNAPYAEYTVYVSEDDTYTLQSQFNPTSNLVYGKVRLRYGISIDDGDIEIINSIKGDYLAGTWRQGTWTVDIENNSRISLKEKISLKKGVHTIKYYQCDPNIALIRMVLYKGKLGNVYGSPEESPYVL
jgi:hypothetical protein